MTEEQIAQEEAEAEKKAPHEKALKEAGEGEELEADQTLVGRLTRFYAVYNPRKLPLHKV
jgi:hypothetical protein